MAKVLATELRAGILIEWEKCLLRITRATHVHVGGRGGAYMQIEAKNIETGAKNNIRLRTDEKVQRPFLEQRKMRFLYAAGDDYTFMDEESFEQIIIPTELLDDQKNYILPDLLVIVNLHNERVIGVELPGSVVLTIVQTQPQAKGATATSSYKPAIVETGITVMVPPFIQNGKKIRVNTQTGEYLERE